MLIFLCI